MRSLERIYCYCLDESARSARDTSGNASTYCITLVLCWKDRPNYNARAQPQQTGGTRKNARAYKGLLVKKVKVHASVSRNPSVEPERRSANDIP